MKKHSKTLYKEFDNFFEDHPTINQKAWGIINEFYHIILTYMEENKITQAELARRLGKSRSAISQLFNNTPNISIKKMVEIADAVGIDITLIPQKAKIDTKTSLIRETICTHIIYVPNVSDKWQTLSDEESEIGETIKYSKSQIGSLSLSTPSYTKEINVH